MTTGIEAPVRRQVLESGEVAALAAWAAEIESWPAGSHIWGHYAEATAHGPAICRTENVSACHAGVAGLSTGVLRDLAAGLLGEPATDFKDKLNYKQPGGAGFLPHQDARAYPGVARVVSVLVAIDECSLTSGCLWIASGVDVLFHAAGPENAGDRNARVVERRAYHVCNIFSPVTHLFAR